jgi:hypothetical protein
MKIVKDLKTASDIDPDADQQCFLGDAEDPSLLVPKPSRPFSQPFDQLVLLGNDQVLNGDVLVLQRVELLSSFDLAKRKVQRLFSFVESIEGLIQPLLADVIAGRRSRAAAYATRRKCCRTGIAGRNALCCCRRM